MDSQALGLEPCKRCGMNHLGNCLKNALDRIGVLQEEVGRLQGQVDRIYQAGQEYKVKWKKERRRAEALEVENRNMWEENKRLRQALEKYGRHDDDCALSVEMFKATGRKHSITASGFVVGVECTCDLEQALLDGD